VRDALHEDRLYPFEARRSRYAGHGVWIGRVR
jgi:hypothetical protein